MLYELKDVAALSNAIVAQAVEDYLLYNKKIYMLERGLMKRGKHNFALQKHLDDVIDFFYSDWFYALCKLDPNNLIELLDEEFFEWVEWVESLSPDAKNARAIMRERPSRNYKKGSVFGMKRRPVNTYIFDEQNNIDMKYRKFSGQGAYTGHADAVERQLYQEERDVEFMERFARNIGEHLY